ncbi:hypothetical protein HU755_21220 [Pseudomonas sp. SWRI111]|uniref:hypothetical protein n=1 Tax=Pseudomonas sp. SWRI111 TaxID=2745507 RepID=UPI0016447DE3|nr:hypothetical protein [Pseudomonas sp. SWRI111]MBC3209328.1 hypothetical protein [Pseudomonas sp. SWRI111]
MDVFLKQLVKKIWSFWFLIVAMAVAALIVAIYFYRLTFGGEFSPDSGDWSAFGGYIGGIFGPLVSFLTLLAVLKTIYLQRELLDAQVGEFLKLDQHQKDASTKLGEQIDIAKSELEVSKVQAYLSTQLELLETLRDHFRREADGMEQAVQKLLEIDGFRGMHSKLAEEPLQKKESAEQKIADLIALSLELSVKTYESVDDVAKLSGPKIIEIIYR